jgi:hypothetical protein
MGSEPKNSYQAMRQFVEGHTSGLTHRSQAMDEDGGEVVAMKRAARRSRPELLGCIPAGDEHQVLQLQATGNEYVRTPCP